MDYYLIPSNLSPGANSCNISIYCTTEPFEVKWYKEGAYPQKKIQVQGERKKLHIRHNGTYCVEINTPTEQVLAKISLFHLNARQSFAGGDGSIEAPFLIETCEQFNQIRDNLHAHYRLKSDLDFRDALGELSWIPIGQYSYKDPKIDPNISTDEQDLCGQEDFGFAGELDGHGHTISGINCFEGKKMWIGIFGSCGGAHIHDLNVVHCRIGTLTKSCVVGTIAGMVTDSLFERCIVKDSIVYSGLDAGGISGSADGSTFSQCQFQGEVLLCKYAHAGAGVANSSFVSHRHTYYQDCCVKAKICGADLIGGISSWDAIISRCFFSGSLSGEGEASGMISNGMLGIVQNCVCAKCEITYIGEDPSPYQDGHYVTYCNEIGEQMGSEYIQDAWRNHVGRIRCDDHLLAPVSDKKQNYCSESCVLRVSSQVIKIIDGSRRDGITIPDKCISDSRFYQQIGWDFDTIWEIGTDKLPQVKSISFE